MENGGGGEVLRDAKKFSFIFFIFYWRFTYKQGGPFTDKKIDFNFELFFVSFSLFLFKCLGGE